MDSSILVPLGSGLIGAVVGAVIISWGAFAVERRREKAEKMSLAAALQAEILAIKNVEKSHKYREEYARVLVRIEQGHKDPMPRYGFEYDTAKSVYYTNLNRIGLMPPEIAEMLVRLAYQMEVISADRRQMDNKVWDDMPGKKRADFLRHHLETYDVVWRDATEVADRLGQMTA